MKNLFILLFLSLTVMGFSQEKLRVGIIKHKTEGKVNATFPPLMKYVAEMLDQDSQVKEGGFSRIMGILNKKRNG
ncbi:MAG: hypothetical protein GY816_24410 [Cytophagales bacterium]|nr:hypothetical protein [Cytophagales bacterium]